MRMAWSAGRWRGRCWRASSKGAVGATLRQAQGRHLEDSPIPAAFWFVEPLPAEPDAPEQLLLRGAVLIRVLGRAEGAPETPEAFAEKGLPPELVAALSEPPLHPEKEIWQALRQDGLLTFGVLAVALLIATLGVTLEAFLLQGVMRLGATLPDSTTRWFAIAALAIFVLLLFALELPLTTVQQRIGRRLETRLRILLLEKIPRLSDRYFHSRLTSDMTMRAHGLRSLRGLPSLAVNLLRLGFQLLLTTAGVILLDPVSAPWAIGFALVFAAVAYFSNIIQREREMRLFTHNSALSRFYLDALLGLVPARMHGAERSMRRAHETLLTDWTRTSLDTWRISVILQGVSAMLYVAFSVVILLNFVARGGQMDNILLLFYWTLNLPTLAQSLFTLLQQYPIMRNHTLRLLEPLGAPDEISPVVESSDNQTVRRADDQTRQPGDAGVTLTMEDVTVQAGGHTILSDINLRVRAGEHVAIVGESGAGKSTLVGILLGWHKPTGGEVRVDDAPLDGERLRDLRRETAWVDPAVQLWNRSLLANLQYGNQDGDNALGARFRRGRSV